MNATPSIILIGGVSGSGKSTIAEKLMKEFEYSWILIDDIRNAMTLVSAKESPLRAFEDFTIYNKNLSAEELAKYHRKLNEEVCKALEIIIKDHLHRNIPMILEGDDLTPEFVKRMIDFDPRIKAFFIKIDSQKLESNIRKRAKQNGEKVIGSYLDYIEMVKFENKMLDEEIEKNNLKSFELSENYFEEILEYIKS